MLSKTSAVKWFSAYFWKTLCMIIEPKSALPNGIGALALCNYLL